VLLLPTGYQLSVVCRLLSAVCCLLGLLADYSGSATLVDGKPRIIIPAVFFHDGLKPTTTCQIKCADKDSWHCPLITPEWKEKCAMTYVMSSPMNLSDPMLGEWSEPITIVDGRCGKTPLESLLMLKVVNLPRLARDKHWKG
jgi:hypothetical protein